MSVSAGARAVRIDKEFNEINRQAQTLITQLQGVIKRARVITAFMHDDPNSEFDQADRDKYSDMFVETVSSPTGLMGCVDLVVPLNEVEAGTMTPAEFVAQETDYDQANYSKRFDLA